MYNVLSVVVMKLVFWKFIEWGYVFINVFVGVMTLVAMFVESVVNDRSFIARNVVSGLVFMCEISLIGLLIVLLKMMMVYDVIVSVMNENIVMNVGKLMVCSTI